jgi:lipopolysaccharide export system protein LptA
MAIQTSNVTTLGTTVYTSSGNTVVTFLSLTNYTANTVSANIHIVPNNGGSAGTANIQNLAIVSLDIVSNGASTGDTYQFYVGNEKLVLSDNDSIQVVASADNSISTIVSYTGA